MKPNWYKQLLDKLFKNELHVQALQSMLKMQADTIIQLRKDIEWHKSQEDNLVKWWSDPAKLVPITPVDPTPLEDPEHWKPLREAAELPSEKRIRLEAKYRDIAKEKKKKQAEMEA